MYDPTSLTWMNLHHELKKKEIDPEVSQTGILTNTPLFHTNPCEQR